MIRETSKQLQINIVVFDKKESTVLMQTILRFFGTVNLGRKIAPPAAGAKTK